MTGSDTDPVDRLYLDSDCRDNPLDLDHDTLDWLARQGESVEQIARVERLRRENPVMYRTLMAVVAKIENRWLVSELLDGGGVSLPDLADNMNVSTRTVKRRIRPLINSNAVEKHAGRPPTVAFANEAARVLASDVLSYYYSTSENNKLHDTYVEQRNRVSQQGAKSTDSVEIAERGESGGRA